jgi:quinol monooxygenase YgiN
MVTKGLWVRLRAKPGKEADLEAFLQQGAAIAQEEPGTTAWFAVRLGPSEFGVFDVFPDAAGRDAHLNGAIAAALMAQADELLDEAPQIDRLDVIGSKLPG